jgi:hypothetical protein
MSECHSPRLRVRAASGHMGWMAAQRCWSRPGPRPLPEPQPLHPGPGPSASSEGTASPTRHPSPYLLEKSPLLGTAKAPRASLTKPSTRRPDVSPDLALSPPLPCQMGQKEAGPSMASWHLQWSEATLRQSGSEHGGGLIFCIPLL